MADRNKFEQMLELLVNEDKEAAEKLFHDIVVEKSRDIYEGLLEDDKDVDEATDEEVDETTDEEVDEATDEEVDEASDEEVDEASDEEVDEGFDLDEFEVEAEPEMGGDAADDMMADLGMDDEGGDDEEGEEPEGDVEDRVEDLEDALDDLKAEFEKMMAGDDDGEEGDMDMDAGEEEPEEEAILPFEASDEEVDEASDEEVDEASDEEVDEKTNKTAGEEMREYVEKVSGGGLDAQKIGGDNGANAKSTVASPNNMGGTASNLNQGSEESGGEHAGLGDMNAKDQDGGNVNVPGGKASKSLKAQPGHGAEKKGKPEAAADKKSMIGS
jgi:E3 ubiquitin-protein ligase HUWE1